MLGSLLKSAVGLVSDVATVVTAPVVIAVDLTRAVTKPVAEATEDVVKDIHDNVSDS